MSVAFDQSFARRCVRSRTSGLIAAVLVIAAGNAFSLAQASAPPAAQNVGQAAPKASSNVRRSPTPTMMRSSSSRIVRPGASAGAAAKAANRTYVRMNRLKGTPLNTVRVGPTAPITAPAPAIPPTSPLITVPPVAPPTAPDTTPSVPPIIGGDPTPVVPPIISGPPADLPPAPEPTPAPEAQPTPPPALPPAPAPVPEVPPAPAPTPAPEIPPAPVPVPPAPVPEVPPAPAPTPAPEIPPAPAPVPPAPVPEVPPAPAPTPAPEIPPAPLPPVDPPAPPPVDPPGPTPTDPTNPTDPLPDPADQTPHEDEVPEGETFVTLVPGPGFDGPTLQPAAIGTPDMPGFDAKAIARWNVVPYQTFTGEFKVGVVAFHINGIESVDFSVDGGPWTSVREMQLNPQTNVWEYTAKLDANNFADGPVEVRAVAWPKGAGEPRVLGGEISSETVPSGEYSIVLSANANGTLTSLTAHVSPAGSDVNGDGSSGSPFRTVSRASRHLHSQGGADGGEILLAAGDYEWIRPNGATVAVTASRWLSVRPMDGVSREAVRIVQPSGPQNGGLQTKLVHLQQVTLAANLDTSTQLVDFLWLDGVHIDGQGPLDTRMYWSQSWWTGIFATGSLATSVVNGFPVTLASNCEVDTLHADAFPGTLAVINCRVRNQVVGIDRNGYSYHSDIWQERQGVTGENIILYGNVATENCVGQGFFTRGSPHRGIAIVDNLLDLRGYPNQTQLISRIDHMVFANNSLLGTPVMIGLSDRNLSVEPYAGSRNVIFDSNVFQWVSLSDPRATLPLPLGMASFAGGTEFVNNHFINLWPEYAGRTGTPHGAMTLGSGVTSGTRIPAGRGSSRVPSVTR